MENIDYYLIGVGAFTFIFLAVIFVVEYWMGKNG